MTQDATAPAAGPIGTRGPKRTAPWDAVLDRWALGHKAGEIAAAVGIRANAVSRIAHHARQLGDKRAQRRRAPHGQAGSGSIYAGAWLPYYADPRQQPLPLGEGSGEKPAEPALPVTRRVATRREPEAELPLFNKDPRQVPLPFASAETDSGVAP